MTEPAADEPGLPPVDALLRYDARVLDPATAVRLRGGPDGPSPAPHGTVYRGDGLLITGRTRAQVEGTLAALVEPAAALGLAQIGPDPFTEIGDDGLPLEGEREQPGNPDVLGHNRLAQLLGLAEETETPLVVPVRFGSTADGPAPAVDVWPLLQAIRARADDEELNAAVGLDHLMSASAVIGGDPFGPKGLAVIGGDPFGPKGLSVGVNSYGAPGWGGHGPVSVVLAPPLRTGDVPCHVVVLDTGVGKHPWFDAQGVERQITLTGGQLVGLDVDSSAGQATDPEGRGAVPDPLTGLLATHAGHGTFIAGLLRQTCPDAHISALRVMGGDGVVTEGELDVSVMALGIALAQQPGSVDALVLSLGYYCEAGDDVGYTAGLELLLVTLADRGVITFAAAGNDCSSRRSYPAAFADRPAFTAAGRLPLIAVAALNPDGSVALFSNDAPWVNGEAAGANVVSTAPIHASGAWTADTSLIVDGRRRGTIDPDRYLGGFATWSGTSFAAPVLAGRFLAALVADRCPRDPQQRRRLVPRRAAAAEKKVVAA